METLNNKTAKQLTKLAIEKLNDLKGSSIYGCDLHNSLFNQDYFIIGRYAANQWITKNVGVFEAIGEICEYEKLQFGEVNTDLSEPENVCNMFVYIAGEYILSKSESLSGEFWDVQMNDKQLTIIKKELRAYLKTL